MATLGHSKVSDAWNVPNLQQQPGLRITDTNPQELGHRSYNNDRAMGAIRNLDRELSPYMPNRSNTTLQQPNPPPRIDSLSPSTKMAGPGAIAQMAQDVGKGMASTLASEKNAYNTQTYLDRAGAPGLHGDWHAQIAKQLEDSNNNRANAYAHVGAMFGPLGMILGQMGAELSQKKVDFDSDAFKTSRTFSGNFNPQAFTSVNAASSINQNNESHIQSTT